jgi:hypothetical protein
MLRTRQKAALHAAAVGMTLAAAPALADSDTLGPVTASTSNCSDRVNVNMMILNCLSPSKCDYAVGVNNFTGAPINYTLTIDAPANYPVYAHGPQVTKNYYEAVKALQAPQSATSPKVKIALVCNAK